MLTLQPRNGANVRFGSFATDPFSAGANQCPLCRQ